MGVRQRLFGRTAAETVDPNRPHPFKVLSDRWVRDGVPPASLAGSVSGAQAALGAGLEFADRHCAVCRRDASDPIHTPAD